MKKIISTKKEPPSEILNLFLQPFGDDTKAIICEDPSLFGALNRLLDSLGFSKYAIIALVNAINLSELTELIIFSRIDEKRYTSILNAAEENIKSVIKALGFREDPSSVAYVNSLSDSQLKVFVLDNLLRESGVGVGARSALLDSEVVRRSQLKSVFSW